MNKLPTFSPTAAKEFEKCPLSFRLSKIDKLPFPSTPVLGKGILVHNVLQTMFSYPPEARTLEKAIEIIPITWDKMLADDEEKKSTGKNHQNYLEIVPPEDTPNFLSEVEELVSTYFEMEDPKRVQSENQELWVSFSAKDVRFTGQIDRLDRSENGAIRIVDYKTGKSPDSKYLQDVTFQLMFYAYLWFKNYGFIPQTLTLLYLKDGRAVETNPTQKSITDFENEIFAIWERVKQAALKNNWAPVKNKLCNWCNYQKDFCPLFGGTPPDLTAAMVESALGIVPAAI